MKLLSDEEIDGLTPTEEELDTYLCEPDGLVKRVGDLMNVVAELWEEKKEAQQKVRELFWEIKKHRWQGHKPAQGFDPPKGYLIREDELQVLERKLLGEK